MVLSVPELYADNQPISGPLVLREWQPVELSCEPPPGCTLALLLEGPLHTLTLLPFQSPGDPAWRWQWNPQNTTGRFELRLIVTCPDGSHTEQQAALEVVPAKLSQQHYQALLDDIAQVATALLAALSQSSVGAALAAPQDAARQRSLLAEYCRFYDEHISTLERLVASIARQPHEELRPERQRVPLEQARDLSALDTGATVRMPQDAPAAQARAMGMLPRYVVQQRSSASTDTPANRLLLRLLNEYTRRVRAIAGAAAALAASQPGVAESITEHSRSLQQRLHALCSLPFLQGVRDNGPVRTTPGIQRDARYRQVYKLWRDLRHDPVPAIDSPLLRLPIHALPRLYECWCVLHVAQAVLDLPGVVVQAQRLFSPAVQPAVPLASRMELTGDAPMLVLEWQGLRLRLRYQPRYQPHREGHPEDNTAPGSLDRHTHVPDIALEYEPADTPPGSTTAALLFDAKYRLDTGGGVPADALADAYTYLGSIGLPGGERIAQAVVLLFPGCGPAEHYASGVGVVPLLPGAEAPFRAWLLRRLQQI
jgi:large subunit ribosomal protein MRP49